MAHRLHRLASSITGEAGPVVERADAPARTRPLVWFYAPLLVGLIGSFFGLRGAFSGPSGGFAQPDSTYEQELLHLLRDCPDGLDRSGIGGGSDGARVRAVLRLDPAAAQATFARRFHLQKPVIVERVPGLRCSGRFARDYIVEVWGNHSTRYGSSAGIVLNRGNGPLEARLDWFMEHQRSRTLSVAQRAKAMAMAATADDDDATGTGGGDAARRSVLERIYAPSAAGEATGAGGGGATGAASAYDAYDEYGSEYEDEDEDEDGGGGLGAGPSRPPAAGPFRPPAATRVHFAANAKGDLI